MKVQQQMSRLTGALKVAGVLTGMLMATHVQAQERYRSEGTWYQNESRASREHWQADGQLVDVQVQVGGNSTPLFFRPDRFDRHYFQAFRGQNYSVVLRNNTDRRVGVVIAVDGLNVVNGERSELSNHEAMYVLDPWESTTIRGWRTSLDEVRRFVFVDEEHSYAARTDQANGDMGWIRVASFREIDNGWGRIRSQYRGDNGPAPLGELPRDLDGKDKAQANRESFRGEAQAPSAPEAAPGTGWGDRRQDPVHETQFRAERVATDQIVLRYEYPSGLRALGIFPPRERRVWDRERGDLGFAQPPNRW